MHMRQAKHLHNTGPTHVRYTYNQFRQLPTKLRLIHNFISVETENLLQRNTQILYWDHNIQSLIRIHRQYILFCQIFRKIKQSKNYFIILYRISTSS